MVFSPYFLLHLTWESIDDGDGIRRFLRVWRLMGVSSLWSKQKLLGHARVLLLYVYVLHVNSHLGAAGHPLWVVSTCLLSQHQPPTTNPRTMAFWRVLLTIKGSCVAQELSLGLEHMDHVNRGQAQIFPVDKTKMYQWPNPTALLMTANSDGFLFSSTTFEKLLNLFSAKLGLRCCVWAFSSCDWGGGRLLFFITVQRIVAPLVAEHGLQAHGSCDARA